MPKQSLTKRIMVRIYNKMVVRWQQLCIDFRVGWSFGEPQPTKMVFISGFPDRFIGVGAIYHRSLVLFNLCRRPFTRKGCPSTFRHQAEFL